MKNIADGLIEGIALVTRRTPHFKGRGHLIHAINRFLLAAGAQSQVIAPMCDGTRMRLDLRSGTEYRSFFIGTYAEERLKELKSVLIASKSGLFLDIGANIGFYTVAIARYLSRLSDGGGNARVIAFEPVPANYARLNENLVLNGLTEAALTYPIGLSDHAGEAMITLREDFAAGSTTGNAAITTTAERDAGFTTIQV